MPAVAARNAFAQCEALYFERCREKFPRLDVLAAKWEVEDLLPGLSDLDFRLIVDASVGLEAFIALDSVIGAVHAALCNERPDWARMLEHPPGVIVTWDELHDPCLFNPETRCWRVCGGDAVRFDQYRYEVLREPWTLADERYCVERFAGYFGPYQPHIDVPINVAGREQAYAWHSRAMHYFAPAVQSAVSVMDRRVVPGKLQALRRAAELIKNEAVFQETIERVECGYITNDRASVDALRGFEERLWRAMHRLKAAMDANRELLGEARHEPLKVFSDGLRYIRCRRGRLSFYLNAPSHFDASLLIRGDLEKLRMQTIKRGLLGGYGQLKCGRPDATLDDILAAAGPLLAGGRDVDLLKKFTNLLHQHRPENTRETASQVVPLLDDTCRVLDRLFQDARRIAT